jgi:hypothetical protein
MDGRKKVIDARLRCALFWPGPSKSLVTTANNAVASAWWEWEEVILYHCKPPVLDLFVKESRFKSKGFEMIAYIDTHFNPSGAVDSLGYIFNMIDIKQAPEELVVILKACFSSVFASGGISINASPGWFYAPCPPFSLSSHCSGIQSWVSLPIYCQPSNGC